MALLVQLLSTDQIARLDTKQWDVLNVAVANEIVNSKEIQGILQKRLDQTLRELRVTGDD
ncbi:MAG: hypothetical protein M3O15_13030 [Acidobacteriota bacterium]|nr:hypothetical protein [Acidobacteriota bacterium]